MPKPKLSDLISRLDVARPPPPPKVKLVEPQAVNETAPAPDEQPPEEQKPQKRRNQQTEAAAMVRRHKIRTFARAILTPGATFMNASAAMAILKPHAARKVRAVEAHRMLQETDVREEIARQLRAIDKAADLDDQWVYDRWRAIANATIFDYMEFDERGKLKRLNLDPEKLTVEQKMVIREIKIDPKTRSVTAIKLASVDQAVLNVARARRMIDANKDPASVDLAQRISERMARAAKRVGHTFEATPEED